ncbi:DEAD/DEAH box helicase [Tenuibacillus multivorans]|uniref:Competence protein ComFA n=1 Tax=Tenuibacillus multivorans TaxID=237069 RepID=A0A1H0G791_9BACI|nr:DEAD/DEAH box helicase family protein [Tenuibacillus multivorans]GEL78718.1 DNA/RNA helicase [Tenuibacillus multivorans]SDO02619.1 competence protein ComFA [Tenuibacillus multivorans]
MNNLYLEYLASQYQGKLLLKQELQLDEPTFQILMQEQFIKEIRGIRKQMGLTMCERCFNYQKKYFGKMPYGKREIVYCRKCIMMGRVSEVESLYVWTGPKPKRKPITDACHWKGELTPLQQKASNSMIDTINRKDHLLIYAVCGAGKTEMLYAGIAKAIESGKRVCIATPRTDVVRELAPRFRRDFPEIESAALFGDSTEKDLAANLVIATTHQLLRYQEAFDVIIVDEVDAFPFHRDKSLPKAVQRAARPEHALIYLTATPRTELKIKTQLKLLPTVSIPMRYHGHPLPIPTLQRIRKLSTKINSNQLPEPINQWIKQRNGRRYLLFAPTIDSAKTLSQLLDIPYVHADSPNRKDFIQQFRNQNIEALITTTILERGVTFPSIDVAVVQADHHVFDEAALVQIAGRAGRSAQDPTGDVTFFYEAKTNAMVKAHQYTLIKNKEAKGMLV